ncbi:MAG: O-antigen ligase family protein [Chloroflexi bacterium]|nr:O-antigen ligase family protein [Chloroflexota bacterium]
MNAMHLANPPLVQTRPACRLTERAWLFAVFAIPLTMNPWGVQVFDLPKTALLRAIVFAMAALWLRWRYSTGLLFFDYSPRLRRSDPRLWALVLALVYLVATFFSVDFGLSLWGTYSRQDGLLTTLSYLTLFLLMATEVRVPAQAERLFMAVALGSIPIVIYGLLQWLALDPIPWRMADESRVLATLGRSNFVGSYLVMSIPLSVGTYLVRPRWWMRALLGMALAGSMAVLAFANARSAWVAIAVAALVTLGLWLSRRGSSRRLVFLAAMAIVAICIFAVAYLGTLMAMGQLRPDRILAPFQLAGSFAARLTIWQASLSLVAERPALGFGPDTFAQAFHHVFPPQLVFYQGRDVVTDRAHDVLLQQAVTTGIIGLVAYLALIATIVAMLVHRLRCAMGVAYGVHRPSAEGQRAQRSEGIVRKLCPSRKDGEAFCKIPGRRECVLLGAIAAVVVGHLVDLLFTFDVASTAVVFWSIAGAGVGLSRAWEEGQSSEPDLGRRAFTTFPSRGRFVAGGLAAAVMAVVLAGSLAQTAADTFAGLSFVPGTPFENRMRHAQRAAFLWPFEPAYRAMLGGLYAERARSEADPRASLEAAEAELATVVSARPLEPGAWAALADIRGQRALALRDPVALEGAEAAYEHAIELAPNTATLRAAYGMLELVAGRFALAAARLEQATALDPTDIQAWGYLVEAYRALGREEDAAIALSTALQVGQGISDGGR